MIVDLRKRRGFKLEMLKLVFPMLLRFFFRRSKSSLLFLTKQKIKEKNPDLYKSQRSEISNWFRDLLVSSKSYRLTVLIIPFAFILCQFDFASSLDSIYGPSIHTVPRPDLFFEIIDHRINNIVTITSISLVVVGFLINNIREKSKDTYELLFEETLLYPIVYFILTVITYLIIVSFVRNSFDVSNIYKLHNLLLIGMLLILFVIFLIGYLFSKIFLITNPANLTELFRKKLILSVKQAMYQEKLENYSKLILSQRLSNYGKIIGNPYEATFPNQIKIDTENPVYITDINLDGLTGSINNLLPIDLNQHLEFYPVGISEYVHPNFPRAFMYVSQSVSQIKSLQIVMDDCLYKVEKLVKPLDFDSIKANLLEKAKEYGEQKDNRSLKEVLKNYELIIEIYSENY